jgi:hypothetical protein
MTHIMNRMLKIVEINLRISSIITKKNKGEE